MLETILAVSLEIAPDLAMIALGVLAARIVPLVWQGRYDEVTYRFFFPIMLFVYASGRAIPLEQLLGVGGLSWLIQFGALALAWTIRPLGPERNVDFAGVWQTTWRFNTALGFVAAPILAPGATAVVAVIVGAAVPLSNALAVLVLARGNGISAARLAWAVASNRFLLATLGGVAFGASELTMPEPLGTGLGWIAAVALPMTLVSVGLAIDIRSVRRVDRFAAAIHGVKLAACPLAVLLAGLALGAEGVTFAALLIFAALPTATAALVQARQYGADRALVAGIIAQSTVFGCLTLPLWITAAQVWALG